MAGFARSMAWAEQRGRDRGLRGPSSAWLAAWVIGVSYRYLRKYLAAEPVVVREVLKPGEQLVVTHYPKDHPLDPPPTGKKKGRLRRRT